MNSEECLLIKNYKSEYPALKQGERSFEIWKSINESGSSPGDHKTL